MPTANIAETPVVMTLHGPITAVNRPLLEQLRRPHLVSISDSQRRPAPGLNYAATIYHGLDLLGYPHETTHDGYLLFVGRFLREKGAHHAIAVARQTRMPLIIAAKLDPADRPYFKEYIEPHLSEDIRWVGEVDEAERNRLMSRARGLLYPATWREPFGLVLIETMACGAPVIAFGRGSIPEIITHGKTGFVVDDVEEMIDAVHALDTIDRTTCRQHVLDNFSVKRMVDGYEAVYQKILEETE
jgi:glycosyltransferase involved in cell wall biosynthesis